jgi:hypothetical protein
MAHVQIGKTPSGYLPTMYWGSGENVDREAYGMAYDSLETAERIGRSWADEQGAEYRPYQEPTGTDPRLSPLIRSLREEHGLDFRTALERAKATLAAEPAA